MVKSGCSGLQQVPKSSQHLGAHAPLLRALLKAEKSHLRSLCGAPEDEKYKETEKEKEKGKREGEVSGESGRAFYHVSTL